MNGGSTKPDGRNVLWSVCIFILIVEVCERLGFYSFSSTITLYFTAELGTSSVYASQMASLFSALCSFMPIIGGWIADEYLNRYRTILLSDLVYIAGVAMVTAAAWPSFLREHQQAAQTVTLLGLLLFVTVGTASSRAHEE